MEFNEKMNFSERLVYFIMKTKMKNYQIKFNEQQSNGEVDFELSSLTNKYIIPVEVTTLGYEKIMELNSILAKAEKFDRQKERKCCWIIELSHSANVKKIKIKIDDFLYLLEKEGITEINSSNMVRYSKHFTNIVKNINLATSIGNRYKGSIYFSLPNNGCWLDENRTIKSIYKEFKPDNIRKLNKGIKEKHFFIYVDNSNFEAWCTVTRINQIQTIFETNIENLTVWVIALENNKCIIWKVCNNCKWEKNEIFVPNDILIEIYKL